MNVYKCDRCGVYIVDTVCSIHKIRILIDSDTVIEKNVCDECYDDIKGSCTSLESEE